MSANKLGLLKSVPLREVWKSESSGFTPWLAQEENIALLGQALGLELEVEAQEKEVGTFRADILCRDTATDALVLIENQLERTDHGHLGQVVTYAAGLEARIVVWIAEKFTDEHRAALDFLNEIGSEKLQCFGLEIELFRIGDSLPAPKFNIISRPNDWSRTVATRAGQLVLTEGKQRRLDYWTDFAKCMQAGKGRVRPQKPLPQHWMNMALGRFGIHLAAAITDSEIRAEVVIDHPNSKAIFATIANDKEAIEREYGATLTWYNPDDARVCRIFERADADPTDKSLWPDQHRWLKSKIEDLHRVFSPRVKSLDLSSEREPVAKEA